MSRLSYNVGQSTSDDIIKRDAKSDAKSEVKSERKHEKLLNQSNTRVSESSSGIKRPIVDLGSFVVSLKDPHIQIVGTDILETPESDQNMHNMMINMHKSEICTPLSSSLATKHISRLHAKIKQDNLQQILVKRTKALCKSFLKQPVQLPIDIFITTRVDDTDIPQITDSAPIITVPSVSVTSIPTVQTGPTIMPVCVTNTSTNIMKTILALELVKSNETSSKNHGSKRKRVNSGSDAEDEEDMTSDDPAPTSSDENDENDDNNNNNITDINSKKNHKKIKMSDKSNTGSIIKKKGTVTPIPDTIYVRVHGRVVYRDTDTYTYRGIVTTLIPCLFVEIIHGTSKLYFARPTPLYRIIRGTISGKGWAAILLTYRYTINKYGRKKHLTMKDVRDKCGFINDPSITDDMRDEYARAARKHYDRTGFVPILADIRKDIDLQLARATLPRPKPKSKGKLKLNADISIDRARRKEVRVVRQQQVKDKTIETKLKLKDTKPQQKEHDDEDDDNDNNELETDEDEVTNVSKLNLQKKKPSSTLRKSHDSTKEGKIETKFSSKVNVITTPLKTFKSIATQTSDDLSASPNLTSTSSTSTPISTSISTSIPTSATKIKHRQFDIEIQNHTTTVAQLSLLLSTLVHHNHRVSFFSQEILDIKTCVQNVADANQFLLQQLFNTEFSQVRQPQQYNVEKQLLNDFTRSKLNVNKLTGVLRPVRDFIICTTTLFICHYQHEIQCWIENSDQIRSASSLIYGELSSIQTKVEQTEYMKSQLIKYAIDIVNEIHHEWMSTNPRRRLKKNKTLYK
jgi:hypothetical protein